MRMAASGHQNHFLLAGPTLTLARQNKRNGCTKGLFCGVVKRGAGDVRFRGGRLLTPARRQERSACTRSLCCGMVSVKRQMLGLVKGFCFPAGANLDQKAGENACRFLQDIAEVCI